VGYFKPGRKNTTDATNEDVNSAAHAMTAADFNSSANGRREHPPSPHPRFRLSSFYIFLFLSFFFCP